MRKSDQLFIVAAVLLVLFLVSVMDMVIRGEQVNPRLSIMAGQVQALDLTDISLFTEARYIRHLSQADRHAAFQDHPLSLEHFPTGSLISPPAALQ